MPTQRCKRCKRNYLLAYYQEPLTICLYCYSTIPENRDLDITKVEDAKELRTRAMNSPKGKRRLATLKREEAASTLVATMPFLKDHTIQNEFYKCDGCNKRTNMDNISFEGHSDKGLCPKCEGKDIVVLASCDMCDEPTNATLLETQTGTFEGYKWCRSCVQKNDENEAKLNQALPQKDGHHS